MAGHGKRLIEIARANNLTQKEIAKRIGVTSQAVNSDFQEDNLSEKRLIKYRDVLGIDVEQFLANEDPPKFRYSSQHQTQGNQQPDTSFKDELIAMQKELIEELRKRLQLQEKMISF